MVVERNIILLHPQETNQIGKERKDPNQGKEKADSFGPQRKEQHDLSDEVEGRNKVIAAAGAGESWVCLGVIPVKIQAKDGNSKVETYALLDSGSEVTLCHEQLSDKLGFHGNKSNFTLTGMTGSQNVESRVVNIVVESMDGSTSVQLANVRTVNYIPIPENCIPTKEDIKNWHHMENIDLQEAEDRNMLIMA